MKNFLHNFKNALILSLFIIASFTSFSQTATAPSTGDGTEGNPYEIATLDNLYWLSQNSAEWDKHYIQTADIDATTTAGWDSGKGFKPIGNETVVFTGSYNGTGHVIDSLYINRPSTECIGLFGAISGTIGSLGVSNVDITGQEYVGGMAGVNNGSIYRSFSTGVVNSSSYNSKGGGFIGTNGSWYVTSSGQSYGTTRDCYSTAEVNGTHMIGGFVGYNNKSSITRCFSTGKVTSNVNASYINLGGFSGVNYEGSINISVWDTLTSGLGTSYGGYDKTTLEMQSKTTYTSMGWFFNCDNQNNTWAINNSGNEYPFLAWQAPHPSQESLSVVTGECSASIFEYPKATNICGESVTGTTSDPLSYTEQGTYIITWTYDEGNGNTSTQEQTVIVNDNTAPVLNTENLSTIVSQCEISITDIPTATDNCVGEITGTTEDPLFYDEIGTFHINWKYEDEGGNITTQEQIIVIQDDNTDPNITCVGNQNKEISATETVYVVSGTEFDPTETIDNCGIASVENDFNNLESLEGAEFALGTTTVTWTIIDNEGNSSECSYDVVVSQPSTGMNDLSNLGIKIYPNPVNGLLNISCENENIVRISVLDITGKTMVNKTNISKNEQIDMSGFNSGIYFVQIDTGKKIYTSKVVKK